MAKTKKFSGKLFEMNLRHIRLIIGICFTMILSIITSVLLGKFIDVLGSGKFSGIENVYYIVGLFVLTILSLTCTLFFVKWFPLKLQLEKAIDISQEIMKGVLKLPQKFYQAKDSGHYINLVTSSSFTFATIFSEINTNLIGNIFCVIILIVVAGFINPISAIVFLIYIPLFYIMIHAPSKRISELQKNGLSTQDNFLSGTKQIVTDKKSINISRADEFYNKSYHEKSNKYLDFVTKYKFFETASQEIPIILMFQFSNLLQSPLNTCFQILIYK